MPYLCAAVRKRQRVDRRSGRCRRVVPLRVGDTARDVLVRQRPEGGRGEWTPAHHRVADLRVVATRSPTRQVLPTRWYCGVRNAGLFGSFHAGPHVHLGERQLRRSGSTGPAATPAAVQPAFARRRRMRSRDEGRCSSSAELVRALPPFSPAGREPGSKRDLDVELHGVPDQAVVDRPVVRRVARIRSGLTAATSRRPTCCRPVEVDADDLRLERFQRRECGRRVAVRSEGLVVDADEQVAQLGPSLFFGDAVAADTSRPATATRAAATKAMRLQHSMTPVSSLATFAAVLLRDPPAAPSPAAAGRV